MLECAALDYLGEGKAELDRLCRSLESDEPSYDIPNRLAVAARFRMALKLMRSDGKAESVRVLAKISRDLWSTVGA